MGFLDRLLKRDEPKEAGAAAVAEPECGHAALIPRWDAAEDIGNHEKIASYTCESCKAIFSREDGDRIVALAAEHVRIDEELRVTSDKKE